MNEDSQYSRLDIAFSHFLGQRSCFKQQQKTAFKLLCAELSYQQSQGHSCIHITEIEQQLIFSSGLASISEQTLTPLILEKNRLYLQRYWFYENRLAQQIKNLLSQGFSTKNTQKLLARYFVELIDEIDWQKQAALKAINNAFSIITGGPGTGKTTSVLRILAVLQELAEQQNQTLYIALTAPTGKAAMRLQESICFNKNSLPCSESIKQKIPETVTTIHRLLGSSFNSPYFKHKATNPLPYDLVVVDEASMVDLALISKLVDALKPSSRLILLGDKDQLASVETGSVLADLTAALPENTTELKKSYRFYGAIKALADAVNKQAVDEAWKILEEGSQQVSLLAQDVDNYAAEQYTPYLSEIRKGADFISIFKTFNQFQILCSNRQGKQGVDKINEQIEKKLAEENKIKITGQWYEGRPVIITQNNPTMQLFNGDMGICLFDKASGKLSVFFVCADNKIKKVLPSRLPTHETVFAMTIHKSQGSEFDECLCILPEKINPVLSRQLIYTAITRAKSRLRIVSNYSVFCQAIENNVERTGGLFEKLN